MYVWSLSGSRTSYARIMHCGHDRRSRGPAVWTSVSATCPLLLTVPIWFDTFIFRVAEDESRFEMRNSVINFNLVLMFYH